MNSILQHYQNQVRELTQLRRDEQHNENREEVINSLNEEIDLYERMVIRESSRLGI